MSLEYIQFFRELQNFIQGISIPSSNDYEYFKINHIPMIPLLLTT